MADFYVEEFHSRDLDAIILAREVAAVAQWKKTKYTFHLMRGKKQYTLNPQGRSRTQEFNPINRKRFCSLAKFSVFRKFIQTFHVLLLSKICFHKKFGKVIRLRLLAR